MLPLRIRLCDLKRLGIRASLSLALILLPVFQVSFCCHVVTLDVKWGQGREAIAMRGREARFLRPPAHVHPKSRVPHRPYHPVVVPIFAILAPFHLRPIFH